MQADTWPSCVGAVSGAVPGFTLDEVQSFLLPVASGKFDEVSYDSYKVFNSSGGLWLSQYTVKVPIGIRRDLVTFTTVNDYRGVFLSITGSERAKIIVWDKMFKLLMDDGHVIKKPENGKGWIIVPKGN